jgi:hypothetical protein
MGRMVPTFPRCSPRVEAALLRLVVEHERLAAAEPDLPSGEVFYTTLFAHTDPPRVPPDLGVLLSSVCDELIGLVYGSTPLRLLTAGFIESPVGCRAHRWHFDFHGRTESLFVPLTPFTPNNGTEYVAWSVPGSDAAMLERYRDVLTGAGGRDLSLIAAADAYRVVRLTAEPFAIVRLPSHLLHRGGDNREPYVRRTFYLTTTQLPGFDLSSAEKAPVLSWRNDGLY